MVSEYYTADFYEKHRSGAIRSAEVMVPIVLGLVPAHSVVDIGCGDGSWLAVFQRFGVEDIVGLDGEYVDPGLLQIPRDCFQCFDLARPFRVGRVFDLAVSLEVAEHLPVESGPAFVESLTCLAPLVLFSAAIPFQGGEHHVNEQWPDKWAAYFREHDYLPIDFIRKRVWQNNQVEWWYAQNTLLFARADVIGGSSALKLEFERTNPSQLALVHPKQYLHLESRCYEGARPGQGATPSGVRAASKLLLPCLRNAARNRVSRWRKNLSRDGL